MQQKSLIMTLPRLRAFAFLLASILVNEARSQSPSSDGPWSKSGTYMRVETTLTETFSGITDRHYLQIDDGTFYLIDFCDTVDLKALIPRSRITVRYSSIEAGVIHSCQQPEVLPQARRSLFGDTMDAPTRPRILVYIVKMCNGSYEPAATPQEVYELFVGKGIVQGRNMADYYSTCSHDQVRLLPPQVKVMGPIEIPCRGSVKLRYPLPSGDGFDSKSCINDHLLKWHYWLDEVARNQGVVPTDYHHKILLLPRKFMGSAPGCVGYAGEASIGPWLRQYSEINTWGTGLIWINGDSFENAETFLHEIGHNLGLSHANIPGGCRLRDQCDHTCTMGAVGGQGIRCFNPPHMWQLGWAQPLGRLNDSDLPYGKHKFVTLPPPLQVRDSYVTVSLDTMAADFKLYFAARINAPKYDLPFLAQNDFPFITVHSYDGTARDSYKNTFLVGEVWLTEMYAHASGVVVQFLAWDAQFGASALFCRRKGTKESNCFDGLDDDCDFLPDNLDPDCAPQLRPTTASGTGSPVGRPVRLPTPSSSPPPSPHPRSLPPSPSPRSPPARPPPPSPSRRPPMRSPSPPTPSPPRPVQSPPPSSRPPSPSSRSPPPTRQPPPPQPIRRSPPSPVVRAAPPPQVAVPTPAASRSPVRASSPWPSPQRSEQPGPTARSPPPAIRPQVAPPTSRASPKPANTPANGVNTRNTRRMK